MHKLTSWAAAAAIGLSLAAVAQAADPTRIVVVTHGQAADPYWSVVKRGVDDAAKTMGVDAEYISPESFDMVRMAQMIDAAASSQPDGMVLSIPDADALGPSMKQAVAAGIPVIVIDSGGPTVTKELGGLLYLGQTEYDAGVAAGKRMKPTGITKAACLNQEVGNTSLDDRCDGFSEGLGTKATVVAGTIDPTEMKGRVLAYLRANPDTEFLLAMGATSAEPALAALEETGLVGKVKLATFDLSPAVLEAVDAGKMEWAIDAQQYLMGYMPIVMLDLLHKYNLAPIADYPTGPGFVTKAEAHSVLDLAKQGIR